MQYQGEHLLPGIIGKTAIFFALIFVIGSAISLILSQKKTDNKMLLKFSKNLYISHFILVIIATIALYFIILNQYFEYNYVWRHSSTNTPLKYIISCFWAGQEGSFLFWILVQGLIGMFFINTSKTLNPITLCIISFVQFFLLLNITGLSIGNFQIGSSPFYLLREISNDPLFANSNYMNFITDGNGLNPLLLNPWMVSHPPLIFIGYALTAPAFGLVVASVFNKNIQLHLNSIIFWVVAAILFLGAGIIVGGAWAYESLTFGGFWAWDPVENASLVPWLILLASLHLLLVAKKRGLFYLPAYILVAASFWFVIYAAFLTRSGVLSETSVHSFGKESNYAFQLAGLLITSFLGALLIFIKFYKTISKKDDSKFLSKEFLMYIGSIFLFLSAFQIIFSTSIPVFNKLFGLNLAPPLDREGFYNAWQLPFAVVFCFTIAISQYLAYYNNNIKSIFKNTILPAIITICISIALAVIIPFTKLSFLILLFAAVSCIIFPLDIFLRYYKKCSNKTANLTHLGVGVFVLGILITFANKEVLTINRSRGVENESVLLLKESPVQIDRYKVIYKGNRKINNRLYFFVDFYEEDRNKTKYFSLKPHIILNENMGNVYEPAVRKYFSKDIFTYITFVEIENILSGQDFFLKETLKLTLNDTVNFTNSFITFNDIKVKGKDKDGEELIKEMVLTAEIFVHSNQNEIFKFYPSYIIKNNRIQYKDDHNNQLGIKMRFFSVSDEPNTIEIQLYEEVVDYIALKIVKFPYINLMWLGVLIMFIGLLFSFYKYLIIKSAK